MNLEMLGNYNEWLKKSPEDILKAVKNYGWAKVFEKGLPRWAHRVRNYFNREPRFLMRLDKKESEISLKILDYTTNIKNEGRLDEFIRSRALSGDIYTDETKIIKWFQMSPGGTIFHFKDVTNKTMEAIAQDRLGQSNTPIFKLISPDGTGGSCETIIKNLVQARGTVQQIARSLGPLTQLSNSGNRDSNIGLANAVAPVAHLIITLPKFQGSYNYAETASRGIAAHNKFDVDTHKKDEHYVNPPDRFSPLSSRGFPTNDNERKPLAEQVDIL